MGLMNHDDDYVSPFDDGLPSYVDPSRRADYLSEIVETKQQMREEAEQRAKNWATQSRKSNKARPQQSSGGKRQPPSRRQPSYNAQSNVQYTRTNGHGATRRSNPVIAQQNNARPRKKRKAFFWMIIVFAVLWGLADPILNTANDWLGSIIHSSGSSSSSDTTAGSSDSDHTSHSGSSGSKDYSDTTHGSKAQKTIEQTGDIYDSSGKAKGRITIKSAQTGPEDYTGHPTVIVAFTWKNTSSKTMNFDNLTFPETYQNGHQLRQITFSPRTEAPGYSYESTQTDVAPGKQFTTTLAFSLRDEHAPIYVQSGRETLYGEHPLVVSAFAPSNGGQWTQVKTSTLDQLPRATSEDRKDMTTIGKSSYDKLSLRIVSAKRGPNDESNQETAIVAVDWINESDRSDALSSFGNIAIKQQGVKLDNAYYYDNAPEDYEEQGFTLNVRPGLKTTTQFAVKLRNENSPLTVTFTPYAIGGKPITATLQLQ